MNKLGKLAPLALAFLLSIPAALYAAPFDVRLLEADGVPYAEIQQRFEREVIRLVNEIRREHGLPLRIYDPGLGRVARTRTDVMIAHDSWGTHRCPVVALEHTQYARYMGLDALYAGESAAWGAWTPQGVVDAWMDSPPHRAFILSGLRGGNPYQQQWENVDLRYIGVGFSWGESHRFGTAWTLWQMVPMVPVRAAQAPPRREPPVPVVRQEREAPVPAAPAPQELEEAPVPAARQQREPVDRRGQAAAMRRSATRNLWEPLSISYFWEGGESSRSGFSFGVPLLGGFYRSPLPFTAIGLETRVGFFQEDLFPPAFTDFALGEMLVGISPAAGLVLPLGRRARVFASALLEVGIDTGGGDLRGLLASWVIQDMPVWATPGLAAGLEIGQRWTFNVAYRRIWFRESYIQSLGIGFGIRRR